MLRPKLLSILGRFRKQNVINEAIKRFNICLSYKTSVESEVIPEFMNEIVGANCDNDL